MSHGDNGAFPIQSLLHPTSARIMVPGQGGFTKREYASILMLQALISNSGNPNVSVSENVYDAITYADELLARLKIREENGK
jgi:hypothetical protein